MTCEAWPVRYPCDVDDVDPTLLDLARESAQNLLWSLSGRRFGVCETTESYRLPCMDPCLPPGWDRFGPGVEWALGWDNRDPCCRLPLAQTPVRAIIEVVEKGVTLDPADYALERDTLWRNGQCWECDDDCDEPPVVVTYEWGIDVPPLGELAMGELTCEFLAAFSGRDCQLPSNAISITRQGVTVDLGDVETLYRMGRIGLPISDAFLRATNPNRLVGASKVYSPDLGREGSLTTDASPFDIADWFLGTILAALDDCDREPLSRHYVAAGEIAWDDCCGTLVVAPERVYRVGAFPAEDTTEDLCADRYLAVDLVALIVRCVPTVDDRGRAPTSAALQDAYRNIIEDGAVVMNAVMGPLPDRWERAAVSQTYVGAQGGCVAVETRFTIGNEQTEWTLCCEVPS